MYKERRIVPKLESRILDQKKKNDDLNKHLVKSSLSTSKGVKKDKVSSMAPSSVLKHMDRHDQRSLSKNTISEGKSPIQFFLILVE